MTTMTTSSSTSVKPPRARGPRLLCSMFFIPQLLRPCRGARKAGNCQSPTAPHPLHVFRPLRKIAYQLRARQSIKYSLFSRVFWSRGGFSRPRSQVQWWPILIALDYRVQRTETRLPVCKQDASPDCRLPAKWSVVRRCVTQEACLGCFSFGKR